MLKNNTQKNRFKTFVMQVFEDEGTAAEYCSVLEGEGHECLGIAEVEAKEVR